MNRFPSSLWAIVAIVSAFTPLAVSAAAQEPRGSWSKLHGDAQNTGQGLGSGATGVMKWKANIPAGAFSVAVGPGGTVYVSSENACVYALDGATGAVKWRAGSHGWMSATAAVGSDGTVYVHSSDGYLYALDGNTGAKKWAKSARVPGCYPPAIGPNGTIYIQGAGELFAIDGRSGREKWLVQCPLGNGKCPAISTDGMLFVGGYGEVQSIDPTNGFHQWRFPLPFSGAEAAAPCIGQDGTVFVAGNVGCHAYALDPKTGSKKWESEAVLDCQASPVLGKDGIGYWLTRAGKIYALDTQTGAVKWQSDTNSSGLFSSGAIDAAGILYVGVQDGNLYAIDGATGAVKWSFYTHHLSLSDIAIGSDGTVFAPVSNTFLLAIR